MNLNRVHCSYSIKIHASTTKRSITLKQVSKENQCGVIRKYKNAERSGSSPYSDCNHCEINNCHVTHVQDNGYNGTLLHCSSELLNKNRLKCKTRTKTV